MSNVSEGNKLEKRCRKELEDEGWLTEQKNKARFQSQDFWNEFDVLAIKGNKVRLIQVKKNASHFYTARKSIKKWKEENGIKIQCEVWLAIDSGGWRIEVL